MTVLSAINNNYKYCCTLQSRSAHGLWTIQDEIRLKGVGLGLWLNSHSLTLSLYQPC